jgi:hypothetical protein
LYNPSDMTESEGRTTKKRSERSSYPEELEAKRRKYWENEEVRQKNILEHREKRALRSAQRFDINELRQQEKQPQIASARHIVIFERNVINAFSKLEEFEVTKPGNELIMLKKTLPPAITELLRVGGIPESTEEAFISHYVTHIASDRYLSHSFQFSWIPKHPEHPSRVSIRPTPFMKEMPKKLISSFELFYKDEKRFIEVTPLYLIGKATRKEYEAGIRLQRLKEYEDPIYTNFHFQILSELASLPSILVQQTP